AVSTCVLYDAEAIRLQGKLDISGKLHPVKHATVPQRSVPQHHQRLSSRPGRSPTKEKDTRHSADHARVRYLGHLARPKHLLVLRVLGVRVSGSGSGGIAPGQGARAVLAGAAGAPRLPAPAGKPGHDLVDLPLGSGEARLCRGQR
ncbi:unnamed protein product, partial [Ectocarpus sp. 12 AP-2014]